MSKSNFNNPLDMEMPHYDKACTVIRNAMQVFIQQGVVMNGRETAMCLLGALGEGMADIPEEVGNVIAGVCATLLMQCFTEPEVSSFLTGENPVLH